MASNKELVKKILEISPEAQTDGLNNKQLTETLNLLKGGSEQTPDAPAPTSKTRVGAYKVAKGKAITSLRGILADGDACEAKDFSGGEATFASLKKSGSVV